MYNLGLSVFFSIVSSLFPTESQFSVLELCYKTNVLKILVNFKVKLIYSEVSEAELKYVWFDFCLLNQKDWIQESAFF